MKHLYLLLFVLPFLGGCVMYDCGYTANASIREHEVSPRQKVPVTFSVELVDYWNIHIPINSFWAPSRHELSQKVKDALEETGLFSTIKEVPSKTPGRYHFAFQFNARGSDDRDSFGAGILAGMTFFLVPAWEDAGFDGSVVVSLRKRAVFSRGAAEKQKCFGWLPLAPLGIFANGAVAWHFTEKGVINHLVNSVAAYHHETYCK